MAKIVVADIRDNSFPMLTIEPGTSVVWRNLDPYPHSAETLPDSSEYFNAGALLPGASSSPVLFSKPGRIEYLCRFHMGMTGSVLVAARTDRDKTKDSQPSHGQGAAHMGHDHLKHYHGFVTGGRSAQRLFMTHTPVLADERHHFQVILQGSLPEKEHAKAYNSLRNSVYGDGKVQVFHDHLALADIGSGKVTLLPSASLAYYPNDPSGVEGETPVPGLEKDVPVQIEKILHFHAFEVDNDYPAALTYLIYGDSDDVFMDHLINRAPSFHSVVKLKSRPSFFPGDGVQTILQISLPSKRIRDVSPKLLERVAFVDNSFHLFWLPPPGVYPRTLAQDPLVKRDSSPPAYQVILPDGRTGQIEIGRFLHFDVRLLNYGVLIT